MTPARIKELAKEAYILYVSTQLEAAEAFEITLTKAIAEERALVLTEAAALVVETSPAAFNILIAERENPHGNPSPDPAGSTRQRSKNHR